MYTHKKTLNHVYKVIKHISPSIKTKCKIHPEGSK